MKLDFKTLETLIHKYNLPLRTEFEYIYNHPNYFPYEKDVIIYTDTDSQFLACPLDKNVIMEYEKISNRIADLFSFITNSQAYELNSEPPVLKYKFKNEYSLLAAIFYGKKMYVGFEIPIDVKELKKEHIKYIYTGLEGKRGAQKIVEQVFNEFLDFITEIFITRKNLTYREALNMLVEKLDYYYTYIQDLNKKWQKGEDLPLIIEELGLPINISKDIDDLEAVSSYYRGTITFDILAKPLLSGFWRNKRGRSRHLYIKVKNPNQALEIYRNLLGLKNIKISSVGEIKDISIPEEYIENAELLSIIASQTALNIPVYLKLIFRKFERLYSPIIPPSFKFPSNDANKSKTRPALIFLENGFALDSRSKNINRSIWRDFIKSIKNNTKRDFDGKYKQLLKLYKKLDNYIIKFSEKTDNFISSRLEGIDYTQITEENLKNFSQNTNTSDV